jgi:hypothetical protein
VAPSTEVADAIASSNAFVAAKKTRRPSGVGTSALLWFTPAGAA